MRFKPNPRRALAYNLLLVFFLLILAIVYFYPSSPMEEVPPTKIRFPDSSSTKNNGLIHLPFFSPPKDSETEKPSNRVISTFIDEAFFQSVALIKELNVIDNTEQRNKQCSDWYGDNFIANWKGTKAKVCGPDRADSPFASTINCYAKQRMVINYDSYNAQWPVQRFCDLDNVMIRVYPPYYVENKDITVRTPHGEAKMGPNMMTVNCEPTEAMKSIATTGRSDQWGFVWDVTVGTMFNGMLVNKSLGGECKSYVNHTVFWIHRWDATNMFHWMEDVVTAYEIMVVSGKSPSEIEIAIFDNMVANNNLFEIWNLMFGKPARPLRARPFPEGTCFRSNIIGIYSRVSLLSKNYVGNDNRCFSSVLKSASTWIRTILHRAAFGNATEEVESKNKTRSVVFISRRPIPGKSISRIMRNEDDVVAHVAKNLPPGWTLVIYRPELYTLVEMYKIVGKAEILFGVHGAAMANMMLMSPEAHIIETWMDDRSPVNRHFGNMARWLGMNYSTTHPDMFSGNVEPGAVWDAIQKVIHEFYSR